MSSTLPHIASLTITLATPTFTGVPREIRDMIYMSLRALVEKEDHRAQIDSASQVKHKLPKDIRNLAATNTQIASEVLETCYRQYAWRATIAIDDIWAGKWRIPRRTPWLKLDLYNAKIHDKNIGKVRFSLRYDFQRASIELAKEKYGGNVADEWRIHVAVIVQLIASAQCTVRAECNITDDILGYANRGGSLRAVLQSNIQAEVLKMVRAKPAFDSNKRADLTVAGWRHIIAFTTDLVKDWMWNIQRGWGPLEQTV